MSETPNVEYTPYGETWIEKTDDLFDMLPYRFTAKELDEETGLYYYGARYLNPRTSRWISSDPAGFELINPNRNGFNFIESQNWYSYVSNNPIKYLDPTGFEAILFATTTMQNQLTGDIPHTDTSFGKEGCTFSAMSGIVNDYRSKNDLDKIDWQAKLDDGDLDGYFNDKGDLKRASFLNDFTAGKLEIKDDTRDSKNDPSKTLDNAVNDKGNDTYIIGRSKISTSQGKSEHEIGIGGVSGNIIDPINTSNNDRNRDYSTDNSQNKIDRIITIGEVE